MVLGKVTLFPFLGCLKISNLLHTTNMYMEWPSTGTFTVLVLEPNNL
jgi:hypothetical protein